MRDYWFASVDIDFFEDNQLLKYWERFGKVLQDELSHFLSGDCNFMCGLWAVGGCSEQE